ncbi:TIM-barrel domain-containing protein [Ereboglobus luteus]|uniref:ABC transporter substrate-binding protein n=1 Tax=Ereboglobus luteus TaxID=1796921 RepID=A0A2U8E5P4_9BACT|nr:TIM-barrel domain-containing protein [Ereboglobus luteus]AWI10258.1 hypothetical protein CKA38_14245 [Ereboglobus luteus]
MTTLRLLKTAACALFLSALQPFSPSAFSSAPPPKITPTWTEVAPGVWKAVIGTPDDYTLLGAAGNFAPLKDALAAMPAAKFPLHRDEIIGRLVNGKTTLRFPLGNREDIYGLGVEFSSVHRNGQIFQLHVDHYSQKQNISGRTHAPVPFYISDKGYGVFINAARYLNVNVGVSVRLDSKNKPEPVDRNPVVPEKTKWSSMPRSDSIEFLVPAAGAEVYVFAGPTPMDAVRRYNLFCGGGALPPKWGLGFMSRMPAKTTADEALAEVRRFREKGFPLDMLGLEPGWHSASYPCTFEWNKDRFPEPEKFLAELEKLNASANLWFNPYVSPRSTELHGKLLPYAADHLVWNGIVPDYTMPEARKIFSDHITKNVIRSHPAGLGGFKIDEVDGYDRYLWADVTIFPSGRDAEQLRQTYGLLMQKMVYDIYRGLNRRTFGQVRGSNGGASPLGFGIYNDNYNYNDYITAVGNASFAGVLWSPEVRGSKGLDQLRRIQAVCWSPLALLNGWNSTAKLWDSEQYAADVRDAIVLRMRLLPYWYASFAQYRYEGTPVIRPMQLLGGMKLAVTTETGKLDDTENPYELGKVSEVRDQYMVGDNILVAPISASVKERKVILPPGKWYDFYTGKYVGANETITVTPPPSQIPLFVRDGGIVPMVPERHWAPGPDEMLPLEVRHYGAAPGSYAVYDDDGVTFDHERGDFSWTTLEVKRDAKGKLTGRVIPDKSGNKWRYSTVTWVFMTK